MTTTLPERYWRQYPPTTIAALAAVPDSGSAKFLAVEIALTDEARAEFLERAYKSQPQLTGARVADVLDMADNADAYLDATEPWWDRAGKALADEIGPGVGSLACIAAVHLLPPTTDPAIFDAFVERLARSAAAHETDAIAPPSQGAQL